ncbi:MAG: hypothetical protein KME46_29895 [Brasilonema angustatum HA4187-MV1]|jgi:hypothetical protein|nr:hypothetical protein [Brasilonema angustatum HA4187-MV1]
MTRLTIEGISAQVKEAGLEMNVNKKQKNLYKYVVVDVQLNPVFGADTLADISLLLENYLANLPVETEAEAEDEPLVEPVYTLGDFEGIERDVMAVTTWFAATPLTCDVLSYQYCRLIDKPPSYWDIWWLTYDRAKRQLIGAVTAAKHTVVLPNFQVI